MPGVAAKRIALIHDWLTGMRGGEKVLELLCEIFPHADVFTLVHAPGKVSRAIEAHRIVTSPLQKLPKVTDYYRRLLPFMPWAIEQFDFSGYDLMISTSHCVAKSAIPPAGATHWCYCHTPMRYIWDQFDDYFGPGRAGLATRAAMHLIRKPLQIWDVRTAKRVHHFLANSENVRRRIQEIYHRDAQVLYPPVDYRFYSQDPGGPPREAIKPYYLIVSALAPYKRLDLAIQTCNRLGKNLMIIGDGPESMRLKYIAGSHVRFLGWRGGEELRRYYAHAEAVLFPGEEDFGIVPLEAMAAGRPVIAYRKGGALETVIENETGVFFDKQEVSSLEMTLRQFNPSRFDPAALRRQAERFSRERCAAAFRQTFIDYRDEMS